VYQRAFRQKVHTKLFGIPAFQVLTVTTKPGRVEQMQQAWRNHLAKGVHAINPAFFLFTDWETIEQHEGDILSMPFLSAKGEELVL